MIEQKVALKLQEMGEAGFKYWYLSNTSLLFKVALEDIDWLSKVTHLEKLEKGDVVYLPGEQAERIFILKQGRVRISRLSPEGKQLTLAILEPGTLFGEMALLEEPAYENIAEALDETWLCWIQKADFLYFMQKHPQLNYRIMKLVGRRMCQIESRLEDLVFLSVEQRLSKLIHYLAEEYGQNTAQGTLIGIKLTHEEMGQMINATRPTVSELLQKMQSQNKIRIVKRQILVLPQQIHAA